MCMQKSVNNSLYALHFIFNISTEFICHSFVIVGFCQEKQNKLMSPSKPR